MLSRRPAGRHRDAPSADRAELLSFAERARRRAIAAHGVDSRAVADWTAAGLRYRIAADSIGRWGRPPRAPKPHVQPTRTEP